MILGPCRCQGCSRLVWWDGMDWCEANGQRHPCQIRASRRERKFNTQREAMRNLRAKASRRAPVAVE